MSVLLDLATWRAIVQVLRATGQSWMANEIERQLPNSR